MGGQLSSNGWFSNLGSIYLLAPLPVSRRGGRQGDGGAASQPYQPKSGTYNWTMFRCKGLGGGNAEKDSSWPCLVMMLPCGRECISAGLLAALLQWHSWTRTWGLIVMLIKHGSVNQAECKEDILLWKLKLLTTPHAWSTWRAKTSLWKPLWVCSIQTLICRWWKSQHSSHKNMTITYFVWKSFKEL